MTGAFRDDYQLEASLGGKHTYQFSAIISLNNDLPVESLHNERRKPFLQMVQLWELYFGIIKE